MKTAYTALIPAYCPDRKLIGLIQELSDRDIECVVVNDGSPEEYDELFHTVSTMTTLITHEENRGKGAALKTGMQYIREHCGDCVVVTVDADGQHLPEDVLHAARTADTCTDTLVLGVRSFSREDTPFRSYYGNKITENVFRLFTGEHVTDTQTGLRAFPSTLIPCMLEVDGDRYEYEMNQLLYCVREKIPFREVTITTVYENNNECSHFHPFRDSFLIYRQILRFGLSSLAGFAVDITVFELFSLLFNSSAGILAANILARVISAVFNYEVNRNVVFRDKTDRKNSALKYFSLACTILLCNTGILYVLTGILGLSALPAKIITEVLLFLFSWTMQNRYVFNGSTGRLENEMMNKKRMFYITDCLLISGLMTYTLLDTFLIRQEYQTVEAHTAAETAAGTDTQETADPSPSTHSRHSRRHSSKDSTDDSASVTSLTADNSSYSDENIQITVSEYTYSDTQIYVADVQLSSIDYLYTAFADNIYGKNVTAKTSTTAAENGAILAINGDYYGARNTGYVLRNGVLYRDTASSASQEDLVIHADGSFSIITEGSVSASSLEDSNVLQVFSFGPALITDGEISVTLEEEVGKAMASNPRTAICEIEPLHYLFVVADGRTDASEGLSLYELAQFLQDNFSIKTAYNLDGGGSSTMVFNGQLVNHPTTSGSSISERSVSDVICIGY